MTRHVIRLLIFSVLGFVHAVAASQAPVPKLQDRVNDLAGILSPDQVQFLDGKLKNLEDTDSTQIAVLIIPSLEGEPLPDYSIRVAEAWRLGQKGRDNGALILIAMKERQVRIEAGYGLEPTLTDARCFQIIRNDILPHFRQGDFYSGIDSGITSIIQVVRGQYNASEHQRRSPANRTGTRLDWVILMLFPLLPILSWTGKWGGTVLGAGAGALLPYFLLHGGLMALLFGGLIGGALGAFLGGLIQASARNQSHGHWGGFGGPFFGGGGFGGGGFGRGGFGGGGGGFSGGGGGFGGGGASGSW